VEAPIRFLAHDDFVLPVVIAHFRDQPGKFGELRIVDAQRGERRRFAFDGMPRFEQFEGSDVLGAFGAARRLAAFDIDTRAEPDVDQLIQLQRDDGLAHRGP
jgi:hypothetical protein